MDDKTLLELAAKAAGITGEWVDSYGTGDYYYQGNNLGILLVEDDRTVWNPLEDDGDALRLAVKLEISLGQRSDTIVPSRTASWKNGATQSALWVPTETDPYAATRRAITRAAAEIGKGMP